MTGNAIKIQWNDLYTVTSNPRLYRGFATMFRRMTPDHRAQGPYSYRAGIYTATFYPYRRATAANDSTMQALRTISCKGARGGAGIGGRSVIYITMHAWFSERGRYLADRVRQMYDRGCVVRVLYSFMGRNVFHTLTAGTGPRMVVRRVLFAGPLGLVATKYSHMKMFAVSGHVRDDRSSWVVWTGSNNWVDKSLHADEVTLRIPSRWVYRRYVRHWRFMERKRSSPIWATFSEPEGGGRAP